MGKRGSLMPTHTWSFSPTWTHYLLLICHALCPLSREPGTTPLQGGRQECTVPTSGAGLGWEGTPPTPLLEFYCLPANSVSAESQLSGYAEYIMRNAGLEEAQARIKIAGRNINNFR
ncbi:hypothetical protein AB1E18_000405 [Capra hircus]